VGDLALAGKPLLAAYRSVKGGHRMNSLVVQALLADTEAWTVVQGPRVRETTKPHVDLSAFAIAAGE
jgi:UDP-3-O-[3-hydroxymyristoyl] N-acetylglucosamine deacetylase